MADEDSLAHQWVRRALRSEMVKHGLTYADLVERLSLVGLVEDERVLRNKIARGTFSAAFFCQCLAAMGIKTLQIDLLDQVLGPDRPELGVPRPGGYFHGKPSKKP